MIISTGGEKNDNVLKTVQYTDDGGSTFHSLPDMPEGRMKHSVASLEKGNIFVFGGEDESRKRAKKGYRSMIGSHELESIGRTI
jgi:hypothetical protein